MFEPTVRRARDAGLDVRAYVSMCFGDPWEGEVPVEQVVDVGKRLFDLGASQLSLGDTIGVGTAGHVTRWSRRSSPRAWTATSSRCTSTTPTARRWPTPTPALQAGITTFDASAGGLGGCPYAKSATGNLATEDLVWMLTGLGIEHGVDLDALVATSAWMAGQLGRPSPSAVVRALAALIGPCMSRRVYLHIGAPEDRHDVPAGPARAQREVAGRPRRPLPDASPLVSPGALPVPRRPRPARPGLGRHARARARARGTRWSGGSRRLAARW